MLTRLPELFNAGHLLFNGHRNTVTTEIKRSRTQGAGGAGGGRITTALGLVYRVEQSCCQSFNEDFCAPGVYFLVE